MQGFNELNRKQDNKERVAKCEQNKKKNKERIGNKIETRQ